jgi:outer membrane immunogenic protein
MRRLSLALLAGIAFGFVGGAHAADMAPVLKAPPAPPAVDPWTGFYVGANGGYSWGPWDSTSLGPTFNLSATGSTTASPDVKGWVAGVQGGYNWRINNTWLAGLEADIQWTGQRDTATTSANFVLGAFRTTLTIDTQWKLPWFDTFRGRVGALIDPTTLIYLTGGAALGRFEFSEVTTATIATLGGAFVASASALRSEPKHRWGGVVGAGVEKKFTPNWSAKAEFLYLDFGTYTFLAGSGLDTSVRLNDYIGRVGVNYKF